MVPALVAALVGLLLGALIVLTGVLAGQRGGCCCCNSYGPVCDERARGTAVPPVSTPGRPIPDLPPGEPLIGCLPPPVPFWAPAPPPPWVRPDLPRNEAPIPGTLMLVGLGAAVLWRMS